MADHLKGLGIEVRAGVAHTGVGGVLRGGRPGFEGESNLQRAGGRRDAACGHDNHVAILMGVAEILAGMKEQLPGTVKFGARARLDKSATGPAA